MRAVIYARVSADRSGGRSVDEQEAECRATCAREGWDVVAVHVDNDRSASRHATKARPAWEAVKSAIADGGVDVLVTWEASRAQRDLDAYAELRRTCSASDVKWSYGGSVYDLADRTDRFRTGLDALVAEDEADRTRERVMRALRANAQAGRAHGRRPYGYRRVHDIDGRVHQEIEPDEAAIVRESAARFLTGESTRAIAANLTERRVPTMRGGQWDLSAVRRLLTNPAYNAQRTHRGVVVGDAAWPKILDDDTFTALQARFADPARRTVREAPGVNLLVGVARCGVCGSPVARARSRHNPVYACKAGKCVVRSIENCDAYVVGVVLARLAADDATTILLAPSADDGRAAAAEAEATVLRGRLDDAYLAFKNGALSATMLGRVEADLGPQLNALERDARPAALPSTVVELVAAADPAAVWAALAKDVRRSALRAMIDVVIHRARRGPGFDPASVTVMWKMG